ncbi:hypothetical protein Q5P01_000215 [Channa striata]|uniref:Uncharacterized protein n=1 Tax=Channa striata TaxID=64152 RepID=A0AA88IY13_CHASR|nr:hypothetical protein Q5P01_000215 [Channa striata]
MAPTNCPCGEESCRCEAALAERALEDRGDERDLRSFRTGRCPCQRRNRPFSSGGGGEARANDDCYERCYGLIPLHRDVESWVYVSEDPQLALVIEEIVNTFSPALSVELLLYNVLGSNSQSATCLVRYLVSCYTADGVCEHIKTTLRNMIRWTVLAGFTPCLFLPWNSIRSRGLGLSGEAAVISMISSEPAVPGVGTSSAAAEKEDGRPRPEKRKRCELEKNTRSLRSDDPRFPRCARTVRDGLPPREAAAESVQEREAHERALLRVLDVPLERLADTLRLLMSASVSEARVAVVCKIVRDWVESEGETFARDPVKGTELKMATVTLWGVMKTFEHGRCPVVPECRAPSCLAFYDRRRALVTALVDGVLYRRVSVWDSSWSAAGSSFSSLAKRAHSTVRNWSALFSKITRGLNASVARRLYTSAGTDRSSLARVADVMLSSRAEQEDAGFSVPGNATDRPLLDNLSRSLACNQRSDMLGLLNDAELPDVFLRSGAGASVSQHKSASISHSLSRMVAAMISEGKEVQLVRRFLGEVTAHPRGALERLKSECKDRGLIKMAETIARRMERALGDRSRGGDGQGDEDDGPVTELGPDVRLVCSYPASVSVAHLEETLSIWTNFWRSALSGFSQFNRRHNTIQYNNRDAVRDLETGSPVHIFHRALVALLNTSGTTFADSLSGRKPQTSLSVNDIMLTRDSLHPTAYGLLLANKLGLRPSDVKNCEAPLGHEAGEEDLALADEGHGNPRGSEAGPRDHLYINRQPPRGAPAEADPRSVRGGDEGFPGRRTFEPLEDKDGREGEEGYLWAASAGGQVKREERRWERREEEEEERGIDQRHDGQGLCLRSRNQQFSRAQSE